MGWTDRVRALLAAGQYNTAEGGLRRALENACRRAKLEVVEVLLSGGANPLDGLAWTVRDRNLPVLRLLLASGRCDPTHEHMHDALLAACKEGLEEHIEALLGAGADPTAGLRAAVDKSDAELLRRLLGTGRCKPESELMSAALEAACKSHKREMIQELLAAGADPMAGMVVAARNGSVGAVRMLLATGRCVASHRWMAAALDAACGPRPAGDMEMVQELLAAGVDPTAGLSAAAAQGRIGLVRSLLATGRCRPAWHAGMEAALGAACGQADMELIQQLLDAGVNPAAGLAKALAAGNMRVVRLLYDTGRVLPQIGSSSEVLPQIGSSPADAALQRACSEGDMELVLHLLAAGVEPSAGLAGAAAARNIDMVRLLLDTGRCHPQSVGAVDGLRAAIRSRCLLAARLLVEAGVDPMTDVRGAASYPEMLHMLLEADWQPSLHALRDVTDLLGAASRQHLDPRNLPELKRARRRLLWWRMALGARELLDAAAAPAEAAAAPSDTAAAPADAAAPPADAAVAPADAAAPPADALAPAAAPPADGGAAGSSADEPMAVDAAPDS